MKTILHFNPEREHVDSEEATVFFFSFVTAEIKLLLLKQTESLCSLIMMSPSICRQVAPSNPIIFAKSA